MSVSIRSFSEGLHSPHLPIKAVALKEWAVCIEALGTGEQVVLLRKGGILEETREFRLEETSFYLYPTYEHQREDLIKPQSHEMLQNTLEGQELPPKQVTITHMAHVVDDINIKDDSAAVHKLAPYHILTQSYAQERLQWQSDKPLHALVVRVYKLTEPKTIAVENEYVGCKSWLNLKQPIKDTDFEPVLSEVQFAEVRQEIHDVLGIHARDTKFKHHS